MGSTAAKVKVRYENGKVKKIYENSIPGYINKLFIEYCYDGPLTQEEFLAKSIEVNYSDEENWTPLSKNYVEKVINAE